MALTDRTMIGVAGTNTLDLAHTVLGIAGKWGTTVRPELARLVDQQPKIFSDGRKTLGDRAAARGLDKAVFLADYTYLACTARHGGMRWCQGFESYFSPENRRRPLILDSAAFREFQRDLSIARGDKKIKGAPSWSNYTTYCQAIDVIQPDGYMAKDVIGDQVASRRNYDRMVSDGFEPIPVWQVGPAYNRTLSPEENGRRAANDPILRYYASRAPMVAIGGMVKGVVPRAKRADYLGAMSDGLGGHHLWGLGQASGVVVNGLRRLDLLSRISVDGSWWIHNAATSQVALVKDGWVSNLNLARTGFETFFTMLELMSSNLRSLLSMYQGLHDAPGPAVVPTNLFDPDERTELKQRFHIQQLDLFGGAA